MNFFAIVLNVFFLCSISLFASGSIQNTPLKNKLLVPLYFKYGVSMGYNDNVFRFSESEKNNEDSYKYMGQSETYDSSIVKPELRVLYSPYIFKDKLTNFIFYFNLSSYNNVKDKSSQHYSIRFDYKIGSYNWFKVGYKSTKDNFLRYYIDSDIPENDYIKCSYDSESIYLNYSYNFKKYGWARFQVSKSNQFFNPDFTEFDLEILGTSINYNYNYKTYSLGFTIFKNVADNISFQNGLNSSSFDRSYESVGLKILIRKKINYFLDQIKIGYVVDQRSYISNESGSDILHSGRSHVENSFSMQIFKEIRDNISVSLKYTFVSRETDSSLEWYESSLVQDFDIDALKSFKENQILIKFTYDIDMDLFY